MKQLVRLILATLFIALPLALSAQVRLPNHQEYRMAMDTLGTVGTVFRCPLHLGANQCRRMDRCMEVSGLIRDLRSDPIRHAERFVERTNASSMMRNCTRSLLGGTFGGIMGSARSLADGVRIHGSNAIRAAVEPLTVEHYVHVIRNPTSRPVFYTYNNRRERLEAGHAHTWRNVYSLPPTIRFDNGQNHTTSYTLSDTRRDYYFEWRGSTLRLFAE